MVMTENRLMLSRWTLPMTFLEKTLREVKVMLDPRAAKSPIQLKDGSVKDARAMPATTGTREATRATEGMSPRNSAEKSTEKKGSQDLMVWVKETATLPRLMLVSRLPMVCTTASGAMASSIFL
eukprot:scaffold348269_cov37-Prasinocladus_malaysianus.AAC.1